MPSARAAIMCPASMQGHPTCSMPERRSCALLPCKATQHAQCQGGNHVPCSHAHNHRYSTQTVSTAQRQRALTCHSTETRTLSCHSHAPHSHEHTQQHSVPALTCHSTRARASRRISVPHPACTTPAACRWFNFACVSVDVLGLLGGAVRLIRVASHSLCCCWATTACCCAAIACWHKCACTHTHTNTHNG